MQPRRVSNLCLTFWFLLISFFFVRSISLRPDGLYLGHEYLWSDWALHIGIAQIFATKAPLDWFAYHPVFADGKFTYAFLVNLISGLLMRGGASLVVSFVVPSIALTGLLLVGLRRFLRHLFSDEVATLGIGIYFLSAGFGFLGCLHDVAASGSLAPLIHPLRVYSAYPSHAWAISNTLVGNLFPQRAFLLGMALSFWGLAFLFETLRAASWAGRDRARALCGGLLLGLLPIAHMHSLIVLTAILIPFLVFEFKHWRRLLWFVVPGAVLASFLYFAFVSGGIQTKGFIRWRPGFEATGLWDGIYFWLTVWGPTLPLAFWALFKHARDRAQSNFVFLAGFLTVFILANLVQFQPFAWDNNKLFIWSYLGFSMLAAETLWTLWKSRRPLRWLAPFLLIATTLTGVLELEHAFDLKKREHRLLSTEELKLAELVRERTTPLARFATSPRHDHLVSVAAARPVLLGYSGWAYNYGFTYGEVEADLRRIYSGGDAALGIIRARRVSYVFVGPSEVRDFNPNENFYVARFPLLYSDKLFRVYDVRSLWTIP